MSPHPVLVVGDATKLATHQYKIIRSGDGEMYEKEMTVA